MAIRKCLNISKKKTGAIEVSRRKEKKKKKTTFSPYFKSYAICRK